MPQNGRCPGDSKATVTSYNLLREHAKIGDDNARRAQGNIVTSRTKSCIFCGASFAGQKRNFEHIIPAWLVQEADLRNRDMQVELPGISRRVGMSRIGLKVCKSCNDADSDLEARAKNAYLATTAGEDLSDAQMGAMLDWLDKVRIGLWLWLIEEL